ncbi:MAG TPA: 4-oxalocrotonate tautomerase [Solirubrobacterales bacterium]|jgi:phenylpyruvate tautomerase PptA (4-oxalocrotonate tautomerase family)|nr:4-oxalocrotonate tautomerase [Solirubrobacterales bacterium]HMW45128.1 4-oxalocrotonate tautomerase [Solirubrobacterales bacterium]HMX71080.1 4-oxalocrotonate tautomerase [Solirubrobacterales bacterium]HMY26741.1 4-oxalocrotonate tautomerase [Solirubrobacterales bacterium]HNA24004.1 4-oxalocrotonate tautomerase [Solirubrobacterales bacterium]
MELTYEEGALTPEARDQLVENLTTNLLKAEGAPNTEFFRSVTWVLINERPAALTYAGDKPGAGVVKLDVITPEGALNDDRREQMIQAGTATIREAFGIADEDALKVWVLCRDVVDGGWGAGGNVIHYKELVEIAKAQRAEREAAAA